VLGAGGAATATPAEGTAAVYAPRRGGAQGLNRLRPGRGQRRAAPPGPYPPL